MKKLTALLVLSAIVCLQALAIPAHPGMVQMPQPDGTLVTIKLIGDEFYHFNTTADGYTILLNEAGAYEYAKRDGMGLVSSGILAHDEGHRTAAELALLATLEKSIVDETAVAQAHVRRVKRNVDLSNFDFDNFHGLVILIDFTDKKFNAEDPKAFYTDMFSTENFTSFIDPLTGNTVSCLGSVRDYFKDQSNGAFKPPFDVYGPFTSTRTAAQCQRYSTSIFTSALSTANSQIDFSRYDNNNDGKVDMIYFLVAGYSSSYDGNNAGYLWPHASNLSYNYISYDGKWMDRYACSTELYGFENSPTTVKVEGIGTICHEFSHVLGLPDFYDTDNDQSGGTSHDPGEWDVMAGGADFNYSRTPVGYTFFERYALGWAKPRTITGEGTFTLAPVITSREGYILRTPVADEFFTIENRQKTGWDAYLPGHGMIVTRVDSTNTVAWTINKVNCDPAHNYFELLRAGNTTEGTLASDPFPGTTGNSMITNETAPSLRTWAGWSNMFNIIDISEKNGIISFTVVRDGTLQPFAYDLEHNGIYYKMIGSNDVVIASGEGPYNGSIIIPTYFDYDGVRYYVRGIGNRAFADATLDCLTIPANISDNIANDAFEDSNIASVYISDYGAWADGALPASVDTLYISSGVTGVEGLQVNPSVIYSYAALPPTCDGNSFTGYDAELHVPASSLAAYFTEPYWSNFINIVSDAVEPTGLSLENDSISIMVGNQVTLTATVTPDNATPQQVFWASTNDSIAKVGPVNGELTALKAGECDIKATLLNKTVVCHVKVTEIAPTEVTISQEFAKLEIGSQLTLTATVMPEDATDKVITWTTTNSDVATVDSLGNVMAMGQGECFITATCRDKQAMCHVIVVEHFIYITLDEHRLSLLPNHIETLTPTMAPVSTDLAVTSTNPSVAAARMANGKIQVVGIAEGITTIKVNSANGYAEPDSCLVIVYTLRGDVNSDGYVNISDVTLLVNYLMSDNANAISMINADVNNDNDLNISDVTRLISHILTGAELVPKEDPMFEDIEDVSKNATIHKTQSLELL